MPVPVPQHGDIMKRFNPENVNSEKNRPGVYKFYNRNKDVIYVGTAGHGKPEYGVKHRLQSYQEKDCFREHPTKKQLRKGIHFYEVDHMPKRELKKSEIRRIRINKPRHNHRHNG